MKAKKLTPNLEVRDIAQTVDFYQNTLGFTLAMAVPESQDGIEQCLDASKRYVYALMKKDGAEIMFQVSQSFKRDIPFANQDNIGASASFYMEVDGLDAYYDAIKGQIEEITQPQTAWYGMREFYLKDINGYILGFAENQEES